MMINLKEAQGELPHNNKPKRKVKRRRVKKKWRRFKCLNANRINLASSPKAKEAMPIKATPRQKP